MTVPETGMMRTYLFSPAAGGPNRTGVSAPSFIPNIRSKSAVCGGGKLPFYPKSERWASRIEHHKTHFAAWPDATFNPSRSI